MEKMQDNATVAGDIVPLPNLKQYIYCDEVDEELTCPICAQPFLTPIACNCGNVFCEGCINAWLSSNSSCPKCRNPLEKRLPMLPLANMCNRLRVKCGLNDCDWVGRRDGHDSHRTQCSYRPVQCTFCSVSLIHKDLEDHEKGCSWVLIHCDCGHEVKAFELKKHQLEDCALKNLHIKVAELTMQVNNLQYLLEYNKEEEKKKKEQEKQEAKACYEKGMECLRSLFSKNRFEEATVQFEKASALGSTDALFALAQHYENRHSGLLDYDVFFGKRSLKLMYKAAKKGNQQAMEWLFLKLYYQSREHHHNCNSEEERERKSKEQLVMIKVALSYVLMLNFDKIDRNSPTHDRFEPDILHILKRFFAADIEMWKTFAEKGFRRCRCHLANYLILTLRDIEEGVKWLHNNDCLDCKQLMSKINV